MKTEISETEFKKRVEAKKRELFKKRVIFVICCFALIAILVGVIFLIAAIVKNINNISRESHYDTSSMHVCDSDSATGVYYSGEYIYLVSDDNVNCTLDSGTELWENEFSGDGETKSLCLGNYLLAYKYGGSEIAFYSKEGNIFSQTLEGTIDFATVNGEAKICAVCARKTNGTSLVYVFTYNEEPEEDGEAVSSLLQKSYQTTLIVSAAISDNGKTLAIGELSESGSVAATKLSLAQIETGKTYYTKIFDSEVLPYLCFDGANLIAAGGTHVYSIETSKSGASSQKVTELCEFTGEHNAILSVAVADGFVGVVGGNKEGTTKMYIYGIEDESAKLVSEVENPEGVIGCGEHFGVYTDYDIKLVNSEGKILGNSEKFAAISEVLGSDTLSVTVKDATGYTIVRFEK